MSYTAQQYKDRMALEQKRLKRGMWVRLKGWQMHWPQENAKILEINRDTGTVILDRKILRKGIWNITDLAKPFKE